MDNLSNLQFEISSIASRSISFFNFYHHKKFLHFSAYENLYFFPLKNTGNLEF